MIFKILFPKFSHYKKALVAVESVSEPERAWFPIFNRKREGESRAAIFWLGKLTASLGGNKRFLSYVTVIKNKRKKELSSFSLCAALDQIFTVDCPSRPVCLVSPVESQLSFAE